MANQRILILISALYASLAATSWASEYDEDWDSLDGRPLPAWYDDAKIGIFVHWGLYSVPAFGSEWFWYYWMTEKRPEFQRFVEETYGRNFQYADFAGLFKPKNFDASQWAKLFSDSGAKYVVITSKHHDGYALWKSKVSWNWNSVDTGPHIDIVGQLSEAVRANNLTFGVYYSLYEWYNPWYLADDDTDSYVQGKVLRELKDLVETYQPEIIWSDGDWEKTDEYWQSKKFLAYLFNQSPVKDTVVVNDRWGIGSYCRHGSFWNCQDHYVPNRTIDHKWENAFSLDKRSWGNRANLVPEEVYSIEEVIKEVVKTVSMNGNVLINVGPRSDGTIPTVFQERLKQLGKWLKINGDAIYGTKPFLAESSTDDIWYTSKELSIYAICTNMQLAHDGIVKLESVPPIEIKYVSLLGCPNDGITWTYDDKGVTVYIANRCRHTLQWAFCIEIRQRDCTPA